MKKSLSLSFIIFLMLGCSHNVKLSKKNPFLSFTKLSRVVSGVLCHEKDNQSECFQLVPMEFNASGVIIGENEKHSYVLTAGHFCNDIDKDPNKMAALFNTNNLPPDAMEYFQSITWLSSTYVDDYTGTRYYTKLIAFDEDTTDACIVRTEKRMDYEPLYLSTEEPTIGDRVYMPSAPMGIHHHGTVLILDGFYSGEFWHQYFDKKTYAITDMPLVPGSSGAAILNEDFEIVSLAYATNMAFPHDAFGVPLHQIQEFVDAHLETTVTFDVIGWFEELFED